MKYWKNDWTEKDFDRINKAIQNHFAGKVFINHRNENVLFPYDMDRIENILGLPYTSTSMCPMILLDCNIHILCPKRTKYHYSFVALDSNKNVIFVLVNEDENEMYIKG